MCISKLNRRTVCPGGTPPCSWRCTGPGCPATGSTPSRGGTGPSGTDRTPRTGWAVEITHKKKGGGRVFNIDMFLEKNKSRKAAIDREPNMFFLKKKKKKKEKKSVALRSNRRAPTTRLTIRRRPCRWPRVPDCTRQCTRHPCRA
jgi:hypothetical protein